MRFHLRWLKYVVRLLLVAILWAAWAMVSHAETTESARTLSVSEAIDLAVKTNLTTQLAKAATLEARGKAIQEAASLLPEITGSVAQSRVFKNNLAAQGFEASSFLPNPLIGPYNSFDARFQLVQKVLDLNAVWKTKEKYSLAQVARLEEDLAAEQVASAAALSYIEDLRTIHDVEDAQSNLDLAQRLATLAHHQHDAGVATGIDVARAETRVAQDRQRLIQAQLGHTQSDIRLKRVIGLPLSSSLKLFEPHDGTLPPAPPEQAAISQAQSDRSELRIFSEQIKAESYKLAAARANFAPSLSAAADYGFSGNTPDGTARTGSIGGRLSLPIFTGGKTHGEIVEAKARQSAAQSQYADTGLQIEEDVRLALYTLTAEVDEVNVSATQVQLAEKELQLAQDRYSAGVGDNIQVVTAQTSLADARKARVDARARYASAQGNLAQSLGHMRSFDLK
jgi:outer membrane protein TolC